MAHWIQVLTGPLEGMTFKVGVGQTLSLGRVNGNDVLLAYDPWISSQHGMMKHQDGQVFLMDLGSSNGSFVNAERLRPHSYVPITGFFVLGATVFKIRRTGKPVVGEPLPVSHPNLAKFLDSPIWRSAIDISRERRFPMVQSIHLLMALRRASRTKIDRLLREMEGDLQDLDARLEQLDIFAGERTWMNRFIKYQTRVPQQRETLVTPFLQRIAKSLQPTAGPDIILESMMSTSYSLIYPLLSLPSPDARPPAGILSKDTKPAKELAEALATETPKSMKTAEEKAPPKKSAEVAPGPKTPPRPSLSAKKESLKPPPASAPGRGTLAFDQIAKQSDHDFASKIEAVLHDFIKKSMGFTPQYSDGSESIQAHKTLSLEAKEGELEQQLGGLLSSMTTAFEHWFEGFLEQVDPDTLEKVAGHDPEACWKEFRYRVDLMDREFTKNHFMEIAARLLRKRLNM